MALLVILTTVIISPVFIALKAERKDKSSKWYKENY